MGTNFIVMFIIGQIIRRYWMRALLILAAVMLLQYATCAALLAHEALPTAAQPQGWSYPYSCCSGIDCRAVPADWVEERPEGYRIVPTGEIVAYSGDTRLKHSPDQDMHWCSVAGAIDGRTICLFVPPRSF